MKKFVCVLIAMMMLVMTAFADCNCLTGEVRVAIYDLLNTDDVVMESEEHDALVAAALNMGAECSEVRAALLRVVCRNYTIVTESMTEEKLTLLVTYMTSCGCGCEEEPEPTNEPTAAPTATPAPTKATRHTHTGGTHQNGGKCTVCGKVYQQHVWGDWVGTSASGKHTRMCTCMYQEYGSHKFTVVYESYGYVLKRCSVCGFEYKASKDTTKTTTDCGCGCSSCKENNCVNCNCGCGNHG